MSSFTDPLVVEVLQKEYEGRGLFKVLAPFCFWSDTVGEFVSVEIDFETDLASIPWYGRFFVSVTGKHSKAAVVHDWCYVHQLYDRKTCDLIFLEAMEVLQVPKCRRKIMYWAVRLGGRSGYERGSRDV